MPDRKDARDGTPSRWRYKADGYCYRHVFERDCPKLYGWEWWVHANSDCGDHTCLVNVDVDTIHKLPAPTRYEYQQLALLRRLSRADVTFNSRFSCQLRLTEHLDGGVFALKQFHSRHLRAMAAEWEDIDNYAIFAQARQGKFEPWYPPIEAPLERDFPISFDML